MAAFVKKRETYLILANMFTPELNEDLKESVLFRSVLIGTYDYYITILVSLLSRCLWFLFPLRRQVSLS